MLCSTILVSACALQPPAEDQTTDTEHTADPALTTAAPTHVDPPASERSDPPPVTDLWQRIAQNLEWEHPDKPAITKARKALLRQPNYLPVIAERAELYLYYIVEQVEQRGMPMEVALLPLVESTLSPFAYSSERAAGLWQIMPATGDHLGLQRNWWYDGRRDLRSSTRAALDYLEELNRDFDGDWLLTLAAYNSGKGRVSRAQRKNAAQGKATDYWSLQLPRETRHYVPRLLAVTSLIADPAHYGAELPPVPNAPAFTVVETGGQIELARAAKLGDINPATLHALNPGQLRWATSPHQPPQLLVPPQSAAALSAGVAALGPEDRVQWQRYRIRQGDSLIRIAKRFDTEVGLLRDVNKIRGSMIRAGDTLMIPQGNAWADSLALASNSGARQRRGYRVRRGDSLYRIAGRFKVSVDDIVSWNSLDPKDYLQPGQRLTLYLRDG